jgi:hypothetical protein
MGHAPKGRISNRYRYLTLERIKMSHFNSSRV